MLRLRLSNERYYLHVDMWMVANHHIQIPAEYKMKRHHIYCYYLTADEVTKIIKEMKTKSCELDSLPTSLLNRLFPM